MGVPFSRKSRRLVRVVVGAVLGAAALVCSPAVAQQVVLYENKNFQGRSKSVGVGEHRLSDFDAVASSIRVPGGLVAVLYEHADDNGGYGVSVDLLEDRPDLSKVSFDKKAAYVSVFVGKDARGFVWARNRMDNGTFVAGHWERARAAGSPVNATAVLSPPVPPHAGPRTGWWHGRRPEPHRNRYARFRPRDHVQEPPVRHVETGVAALGERRGQREDDVPGLERRQHRSVHPRLFEPRLLEERVDSDSEPGRGLRSRRGGSLRPGHHHDGRAGRDVGSRRAVHAPVWDGLGVLHRPGPAVSITRGAAGAAA